MRELLVAVIALVGVMTTLTLAVAREVPPEPPLAGGELAFEVKIE